VVGLIFSVNRYQLNVSSWSFLSKALNRQEDLEEIITIFLHHPKIKVELHNSISFVELGKLNSYFKHTCVITMFLVNSFCNAFFHTVGSNYSDEPATPKGHNLMLFLPFQK